MDVPSPGASSGSLVAARRTVWTRDFILLWGANLALWTAFQMLMPTLPLYIQRLGGNDATVGLNIALFTIAAVIIRPFTGAALDAYGRRPFILVGLAILGLCVLSFSWAGVIPVLLTARFLHGFGWGLASTSFGTVATDIIPPRRLGEGMGYYSLAGTLGMAIAPAIGLAIAGTRGFSLLFVTSAVVTGLALIMAAMIKHMATAPPQRVPVRLGEALLEKGAVGPSLVMFSFSWTYSTVITFLTLHAAREGIANIGPFFVVYSAAILASRPLAGYIVDRRGFNVVMIPGLLIGAASMIALGAARTLPTFLVAAIPFGLSMGVIQPSLQALSVRGLPLERRGAANATFFTAWDLGIAVSAPLGGLIAARWGYAVMYAMQSAPALSALALYFALCYRTGGGRAAPGKIS